MLLKIWFHPPAKKLNRVFSNWIRWPAQWNTPTPQLIVPVRRETVSQPTRRLTRDPLQYAFDSQARGRNDQSLELSHLSFHPNGQRGAGTLFADRDFEFSELKW